MIPLTSDTLTKPTPSMLKAMFMAPVGDDVFGQDPSINRLEAITAEKFGMDAALFCPSGTMSNQIAIKMHTRPLDEVICDVDSHIYQYEVGGYAYHSGVAIQLLQGDLGRITAEQIEASIRPDKTWLPKSRLVVLENTCNRGGGSYYKLEQVRKIQEVCRTHQLGLHLDGARIFNALVETKESPEEWGRCFDSISVCLSKGLGAPVGSLLLGEKSFIHEARRVRKAMGGGMRQAGYLAAAGIYALEHHIERLTEDHEHARMLEKALLECRYVSRILPIETNILIFETGPECTAASFAEHLKTNGIEAIAISPNSIRFVTHLDVSRQDIEHVQKVLISMDLK